MNPVLVMQATSAESAQSFLLEGGRFLLTLSMALFLSYLLFLLGAVVLSAVLGRVRGRRQVPARSDADGRVTGEPLAGAPEVDRTPALQDAKA